MLRILSSWSVSCEECSPRGGCLPLHRLALLATFAHDHAITKEQSKSLQRSVLLSSGKGATSWQLISGAATDQLTAKLFLGESMQRFTLKCEKFDWNKDVKPLGKQANMFWCESGVMQVLQVFCNCCSLCCQTIFHISDEHFETQVLLKRFLAHCSSFGSPVDYSFLGFLFHLKKLCDQSIFSVCSQFVGTGVETLSRCQPVKTCDHVYAPDPYIHTSTCCFSTWHVPIWRFPTLRIQWNFFNSNP